MPSITGGQFKLSSRHDDAKAASSHSSPGHYGLGHITHSTVAGGHDSVAGSGSKIGSGFDTVSGPDHTVGSIANASHSSTEHVVATQTHEGGNTILHLPDGSSITIVGIHHTNTTFFH